VNVTNEPLDWCDSHHATHWADGGTTDLDNLVLLYKDLESDVVGKLFPAAGESGGHS